MNRITAVMALLLVRTFASGQGSSAFEFLYSITDEIVILKPINERTASESLIQCKAYVEAEVIENLKVKRFSSNERIIHFVRILSCNEKITVSENLLLDKNKQYIVFLSSEDPGYDLMRKHKEYGLSDLILGVHEYDEDLAKYIRSKQKLKN